MSDKVFISHSSMDHDFVLRLANRLKSDLINVWIDDWELKVGDAIVQKISVGLERCDFLIIVFSENSIKSEWVLRELNSTLMRQLTGREVTILPILLEIEPEMLPPLFSDIYAARFSTDSLVESEYQKLIKPIKERTKSNALSRYQDAYFDNIEHIDIIVNKKQPTKHEVDFILRLIIEKHYQNYFFKKVAELHWFNILKEEGYFKPSEETKPQEAKQRGLFSITQWNVLPYLEKISEQVNTPGNEGYVDELLNIIREVTGYHVTHDKCLDNYRTWLFFVKILRNLPNNKITFEDIELVSVWLDSKFDITLQGAEIAEILLSKFLDSDDPEDWKKAEKIVEIVTDIKWIPLPEGRKDAFGKSEEPKTLLDAYWLLKSFKVNASKVGEKCSEDIILRLADRLKEIIRRERDKHGRTIGYGNKKFRISINLLKDNGCKISLLPTDSEDETIITNRSEIMSFDLIACQKEDEFVSDIKRELIKIENFSGLTNELDEELKQLHEEIFNDYTYIWLKSLFSNVERTSRKADTTLMIILRDILGAKAGKDKENTMVVLNQFLSDKYPYPIFTRMVFFVIGSEWEHYKGVFWNIIEERGVIDLFDAPSYKSELYMTLKNNINLFTLEEKEKIKSIIERGPSRYLPEEDPDKYIAYWKQKWYSAVKTDPYFASLYEEQRRITQVQEELTFLKEPEVMTGPGPSPLTKEDILRISNIELAEYFKIFRTKDIWKGPTVGGLAELLGEAAKEMPARFIEDMNPFMNVGYLYVYEILSGIKSAWNEKRSIDWERLLSFIKAYINRDEFWNNSFVIESPEWPTSRTNHEWVVSVIADLIQDATRDAQWIIPEEYFVEIQDILFLILDRLKIEQEKEDVTDFITYTINTSLGRLLIALIYLALRMAKANEKKGIETEVKWNTEFREEYNKILGRGAIEAFTLLGQYMPTLYYLDKEWIKEKVAEYESMIGSKAIEAFMEGYLFGERVSDALYKLMRPYYLYYIDYSFREKNAEERLMHHISVEYLRGYEDIEDTTSLIRNVLDRWKSELIPAIIDFLWMQRNYLDPSVPEHEDIKKRIIDFWRWLYDNKYREKKELNKEDKSIVARLSRLTVFLDRIDPEKFDWLIFSARHVDLEFSSPFFIEYLDRFEDHDSIRKIGKIFLEMLSNFTPDFDQEHIRSVVKKLYKLDDKNEANKICNIYGSRGYEFLRDIYDANNNS
jgi:hypothetical protein